MIASRISGLKPLLNSIQADREFLLLGICETHASFEALADWPSV
jgi:hypothetical protein